MTVGPRCEVVLHDIQAHDYLASSIIAIENGHVTGRHVGGPSTNLGLEALRDPTADPDRFSYRSRTPEGHELRCSSIYFRGSNGQLIGALCINLDVQPYVHARDALDELIGRDVPSALDTEEVFGTEIGDVLDGMVQLAVSRVGIPVNAMTRDDKVAVDPAPGQEGGVPREARCRPHRASPARLAGHRLQLPGRGESVAGRRFQRPHGRPLIDQPLSAVWPPQARGFDMRGARRGPPGASARRARKEGERPPSGSGQTNRDPVQV